MHTWLIALYVGLYLDINARQGNICKGAVLAVLADTQAVHYLGGFKIGVGFSLRPCRNCLATKETMKVGTSIYEFISMQLIIMYIHASIKIAATGVFHCCQN